MRASTLLVAALATAIWLAVVLVAAPFASSRSPLVWCRVVMMVATVLYLVAVRLVLLRERRLRIPRAPARP
jgi:hypothetical protein